MLSALKRMFRPANTGTQLPQSFHLKPQDGKSENDLGFEYAIQFLGRPLEKGQVLFGQIIGNSDEPSMSGKAWRVKLATDRGVVEAGRCGSIVDPAFLKQLGLKDEPLKSGDLVGVKVAAYDPQKAIDDSLQYFLIAVKLAPTIDPKSGLLVPSAKKLN